MYGTSTVKHFQLSDINLKEKVYGGKHNQVHLHLGLMYLSMTKEEATLLSAHLFAAAVQCEKVAMEEEARKEAREFDSTDDDYWNPNPLHARAE